MAEVVEAEAADWGGGSFPGRDGATQTFAGFECLLCGSTKVNKLQQRSTEFNKSQHSTTIYDALRQLCRLSEQVREGRQR